MKVECLVENISSYLSVLSKALPTHTQVPVLSNVLLEATATGFFICATDLEFGVRIKIPAKIEEEGSVTVPGKQFIEVMHSLAIDKVRFESEKDILKVKSRGNILSFQTIPPEEFPHLGGDKGSEKAIFDQNEFQALFSPLTFSVSSDTSRPQLTGILFAKKGTTSDFVATDGYRLSIKTFKKDIFQEGEENIVVGARIINELLMLKSSSPIHMYVSPNGAQVSFECGDILLVGRLIEGDFPAYQRVIPQGRKTRITLDKEEFLQGVRLSSVFARDSANVVRLVIVGTTLSFHASSQGVGEGDIKIDVKKDGEDNEIAFNVKFLIDFLRTIDGKTVTLDLNTGLEPGVFRIDTDTGFLHIIMPVKVQE